MTPHNREYLDFASYRLDVHERVLLHSGEPVALTPKAAEVLHVLLEAAGRLVPKDELLEQVWPDTQVEEANITFQIHLVRRALGDDRRPDHEKLIQTVPKRGYRFSGSVTRVSVPLPTPQQLTAAESAGPRAFDASASRQPAASGGPFSWPPSRSVLVIAFSTLLILTIAIVAWSRIPAAPMLQIVDYTPLTHDGARKDGNAVFADAAHVYFHEAFDRQLFSVPTMGGDIAPVSIGTSRFNPIDVNARRQEFLATRSDRTGQPSAWVVPVVAGPPRPLLNVTVDALSWSPDGGFVTYLRDGALYIAGAEGGHTTRIPMPAGFLGCARVSPDDRLVRFVIAASDDYERSTLWEAHTDGTHLRKLLPDFPELPERQHCGAWSPDGRLYVFESTHQGRSDLWALPEAPGAAPVRLTSGPLSYSAPAFSIDGSRIFAVGSYPEGEAVRYDAAQKSFIPLTASVSGIWINYSPDREWIVYSSFPDNTLWRMRTDGTQKRRLTPPPFATDGAAWSPDGQRIAFRSRMGGAHMKIYVMPATGGNATSIVDGDIEQGIPSWSADGRQLTFGDVPTIWEHPTGAELLRTYDLATRQISTIRGSEGLWSCRWSHRGRELAALTVVGQQLRIFDTVTQRWRALPADHVQTINWSHDDRYIYYDTEHLPHMLRRVRVSDGQVDDLLDLTHYPVAAYWWSGLTPQDEPIILRDLAPSQIYALELGKR